MNVKKYSQNFLEADSLDYFARALSKEILLINSNKTFKAFNVEENSHYNIVTYLYDSDKIDEETQKRLKDLIGESSFCCYNEKADTYEIFLSIYSIKLLNSILNREKIFFRNKTIDFKYNDLLLRKEILLSTYRHELAHIKISDMKNEHKAFDYVKDKQIPFEIFNILEDIRVNSFWLKDYMNNRVLLNELYKVDMELFKSNKTLKEIFFQIAITLDNSRYTYLSPDYPYMKDLFYRVQNSKSALEVAKLSEELFHKINNNVKQDIQETNEKAQNQDNESKAEPKKQDNKSEEETKQRYDEPTEDFDFDFNDLLDDDCNINDISSNEKENNNEKIEAIKILGSGDMLSKENVEAFARVISALKGESIAITDDGNIIKNIDKNYFTKFNIEESYMKAGKEYDFLRDSNPSLNISSKAIKELEKEIEKKLKKDYSYEEKIIDDLTDSLNELELYSIPTNPTLEDIFIENKKLEKETPNFVFFCDLSGSMFGIPITTSKYVLASLQNLAKKNILNAKVVLHGSMGTTAITQIFDVLDIDNKYIDRIGNLLTYDAEGILNAIKLANNKISKELKTSRAIFFLSDCNLAENPMNVKKAISTFYNDNIYAIYGGKEPNHQTITDYFSQGIAVNNKKTAFAIAKEIILAIIDISNKELNNENALELLKKNKNLTVYSNKENSLKNLRRITKHIKI